MISGQQHRPGQRHIRMPYRSYLLRQYPVLTPVMLIAGAIVFFIASFSANTLFPVLAFLAAPLALLCLMVASVLGISGILIAIISIIESIDSHCLQRVQAGVFAQSKEQSYANRN